jgi:effector-binding domain-containing protein
LKALRLYDENGLLPPAEVDASTGYRYYRAEQANRAEVIKILRSMEMPLEEIRAVLDANNDDAANKQLLVHKDRLTERLAIQERMLSYLQSLIRNKGKIMTYEVHVTEQKPQWVAGVKIHTSLKRIAADVPAGFGALMQGLGRGGAAPIGAPMIVYHSVIDEETDGDIELCAPVKADFIGDSQVKGRELEGGKVASTVHRGPYEQISPAYHFLAGWIADNGFEISGPPRETYLNDPRMVASDQLLTRIDYPISTKNGEPG